MPRKPPRNTPLFQNTRCLATIPGESGDSGHKPSLEGRAKNAFHRPFTNDFSAKEKHSPRFRFRVDNERFRVLERFHSSIHATQDSVAKTPYFLETISRPALIMGETGDSGHDLGFGEIAKLRVYRPFGNVLLGAIGATSQIRDQGG